MAESAITDHPSLRASVSRAHARFLPAFVKVVLCYLGAAALLIGIGVATDIELIRGSLKRLAWSQSPYASFPFPYELGDDLSIVRVFEPQLILLGLTMMGTFLGGLHLVIFGVCAVLHRHRAVPNYWHGTTPPPDMVQLLLRSARLGFWIAALLGLNKVLLQFQGESMVYGAWFPLPGNLLIISSLVVAALVWMVICSRVIKQGVLSRVGRDDIRCFSCEYLLRGLPENRCPECAREFDPAAESDYRLRRDPVSFLMTRSWRWVAAICLAIYLLPIGIAWSIRALPLHVQMRLPISIVGPVWGQNNSNAFPIRLDSVCIITRGDRVGIVRFEYVRPECGRFRAQHWTHARYVGNIDPGFDSTDHINPIPHGTLAIGPWTLSTSNSGGRMFWLYRPDSSYEVRSYLLKDVPEFYRSTVASMTIDRP